MPWDWIFAIYLLAGVYLTMQEMWLGRGLLESVGLAAMWPLTSVVTVWSLFSGR